MKIQNASRKTEGQKQQNPMNGMAHVKAQNETLRTPTAKLLMKSQTIESSKKKDTMSKSIAQKDSVQTALSTGARGLGPGLGPGSGR